MPGRVAAVAKPCMAFPRTTPERIQAGRFSVCAAALKTNAAGTKSGRERL
jgi:hypothetical protein